MATLSFWGGVGTVTGSKYLIETDRARVLGQWVPVRCRIERIGSFSAHADWQESLRWLEGMTSAPRQTFLTHGEPAAANAMAAHIKARLGWNATVPVYGERFEVS